MNQSHAVPKPLALSPSHLLRPGLGMWLSGVAAQGCSLLLPLVFGQNLNSLFLVRCYALRVFNRNYVCVLFF